MKLMRVTTEMLPESVKNFFAREQMLGVMSQRIQNLDSFGKLKELIQDEINNKQEQQNEVE